MISVMENYQIAQHWAANEDFQNIFKIGLGRPKGRKSKVKKLTGKGAEIKNLLDRKVSKSAIARILGVHRLTVAEFVKAIQ
jgi:DNA invertase Pin-like site-specific DNA recombinase